jgi:hypothetical protein
VQDSENEWLPSFSFCSEIVFANLDGFAQRLYREGELLVAAQRDKVLSRRVI